MAAIPEVLVKTFVERFPEVPEESIRAALKAADGHGGKAAAQLRKQAADARAKASRPPTPKAAPKVEPSADTKVDSIASQFPGVDKERIRDILKKHNDHAGRAAKELRAASGSGFELAFLQRRFPGVPEQTIKQALVKANGDKSKAEKDCAKAYLKLQATADKEQASEAGSSTVPSPRAPLADADRRATRRSLGASAAGTPLAAAEKTEVPAAKLQEPLRDLAPTARTLKPTPSPSVAEPKSTRAPEARETAVAKEPQRYTPNAMLGMRGGVEGQPSTSYTTQQRPLVDDTRFTPNELLKLRGDGATVAPSVRPLYTAAEVVPVKPLPVVLSEEPETDGQRPRLESRGYPNQSVQPELAAPPSESRDYLCVKKSELAPSAPPVRDFRDYLKASDTQSAVAGDVPVAAAPARDFRDYLKASDAQTAADAPAADPPVRDFRDYLKAAEPASVPSAQAAAPPARDFRDYYKPRPAPAAEASLPSTTVLLTKSTPSTAPSTKSAGLRQWGIAKTSEPLPTVPSQAIAAPAPSAEVDYRLGDAVQVLSTSQQAWLDGEVVELAAQDGELSGAFIPMGSLFVHYSGTAQNLGKWIVPELIPTTIRPQDRAA